MAFFFLFNCTRGNKKTEQIKRCINVIEQLVHDLQVRERGRMSDLAEPSGIDKGVCSYIENILLKLVASLRERLRGGEREKYIQVAEMIGR